MVIVFQSIWCWLLSEDPFIKLVDPNFDGFHFRGKSQILCSVLKPLDFREAVSPKWALSDDEGVMEGHSKMSAPYLSVDSAGTDSLLLKLSELYIHT